MRQKADKLEKGKWYSDTVTNKIVKPTFLRFSHMKNGSQKFDSNIGRQYETTKDGFYTFSDWNDWYLPTPEDIEKYNLNEE